MPANASTRPDVCKRLSSQYLKEDYAQKVMTAHLEGIGSSVSDDNFILMDGYGH